MLYTASQGFKIYSKFEYEENMKKFSSIDDHYAKQIKMTEQFYEELIKTVELMKEDHLGDLIDESQRHSQIADIENDYLRENVDEMENIRRDIEDNLETIMEKLSEEELHSNLNEYKQKIQVYRHKVEEQADIFEELINYNEEELTHKHTLIQDYLMDVWAENDQKNKHTKPTVVRNHPQNFQEQPKSQSRISHQPQKSKENYNFNQP